MVISIFHSFNWLTNTLLITCLKGGWITLVTQTFLVLWLHTYSRNGGFMTLSLQVIDARVCWQWCELSICLSPGYWREIGVTHLWGTGSHQILHISFSLFPSSLNFALYAQENLGQSITWLHFKARLSSSVWGSDLIADANAHPSVSELAALGSPLVTGGKSGLIHLH